MDDHHQGQAPEFGVRSPQTTPGQVSKVSMHDQPLGYRCLLQQDQGKENKRDNPRPALGAAMLFADFGAAGCAEEAIRVIGMGGDVAFGAAVAIGLTGHDFGWGEGGLGGGDRGWGDRREGWV